VWAASVIAVLVACGGDEPTVDPARVPGDAGEIQGPRPPACDEAAVLPTDLRCTGLYSDFATKAVAADAREIAPAVSLWSDGAVKRRWLFLPPGSQIDTSDMDEWIFPVGTKVWKEFSLDGKVVETRMFAKKAPSRWVYTTYVWDKDGARASRVDTGLPNAAGTYEIPSTVHCSQCHNGHADRLLGVEAVSLGLPGAGGLTLATLANEGRLSNVPAKTTFTLPGDERTQRALGYLHVNCGITCHSQAAGGTASFTGMLLRLSAKALLAPPGDGGSDDPRATDTYKTTVNKDFVSAPYVDEEKYFFHKRITPGNPDKSLVFSVIAERGAGQMPPIVSHRVDDAGVALLRDWIAAIP
jgi:hypothetical protein